MEDRKRFLEIGREALADLPGTVLVAASHVYETAPLDLVAQPDFLNQVVCLETELDAPTLLRAAQEIEAEAGRERSVRFGPRTLDIDILLFEGVESEDPELTIPHPRMTQRAFVMVPLAELWECARGMPDIAAADHARGTSRTQTVRRLHETED